MNVFARALFIQPRGEYFYSSCSHKAEGRWLYFWAKLQTLQGFYVWVYVHLYIAIPESMEKISWVFKNIFYG